MPDIIVDSFAQLNASQCNCHPTEPPGFCQELKWSTGDEKQIRDEISGLEGLAFEEVTVIC